MDVQRKTFLLRRWSRSPPPRRSPSPYRRRRSPSPLPPRRYRSRSPSPPPPRRRSPSPPGSRRRTGSTSPPRRRSPGRKSLHRSLTPELSEWETDTENEEEREEEELKDEKQKEEQKETKEKEQEATKIEIKKKTDAGDEDDGPDDFLKLDATAGRIVGGEGWGLVQLGTRKLLFFLEVDEFSQFLNEFEDEVLDESKKKEASVEVKKAKKDRPVTEKKVVDGKRMRKKVNVIKLN